MVSGLCGWLLRGGRSLLSVGCGRGRMRRGW
nr:MAG TPA: Spermine/spermidine synthase domain [Caudoviricetes sp.]